MKLRIIFLSLTMLLSSFAYADEKPIKDDLRNILLQNNLSSIEIGSCYVVSQLQVAQVLPKGILVKFPDYLASQIPIASREYFYIQMKTGNLADGELIETFYTCATKPYSYNSLAGRRTVKAFRKID